MDTDRTQKPQTAGYRRKADEAEARAKKASTESIREGWRRIAECYREMAGQIR